MRFVPADDAVIVVSVTVAQHQRDLPPEAFGNFEAWMSADNPAIISGVVAQERGGLYGHEHLQAVVKVYAKTPQQVRCSGACCVRHLNAACVAMTLLHVHIHWLLWLAPL